MEWVLSFIKNICVFTLVMTLVLNIFPESNYRKYIKLFAGFLLLVLVMQPILKLKNIDFKLDDIVQDIEYEQNDSLNEKESVMEEMIHQRIGEMTTEIET